MATVIDHSVAEESLNLRHKAWESGDEKRQAYEHGNSEPISPELLNELKALEAMPDSDIDTSDIPEVTDGSNAVQGKFYRPVKQLLSVRLDADLIDWFKSGGSGYQTRINTALREYVQSHSK